MGEVDQIPTGEFPMAVGRWFLMLKADDEVHRVLPHFISRDLRLEIESAKGTVPAPYGIKFWIEIINAMRFLIDQLQVGVSRTLETTFACFRKIGDEPRGSYSTVLASNLQRDCSLR